MEDQPQGAPLAPKKSRGWALPAITALSVAGAGGAGYYATDLHQERKENTARLGELEEENRALSDALELHRSSKVDLDTRLRECKQELDTEQETRAQTGAELAACQSTKQDLEAQRQEAKKIMGEFETLTKRFRKMIDTGKLDVVFRRNQMVVKLPAKVLFPSGSATLSEGGQKALGEVAAVLRKMPRRRFTVAGHTDNVPVRGEEFESNWELSTARAVTVTGMLIENGVKPRNLVAAGYGPYAPVASNKRKRGRQRNRRIEIILQPDLRKLPIKKLRAEQRKRKKERLSERRRSSQ